MFCLKRTRFAFNIDILGIIKGRTTCRDCIAQYFRDVFGQAADLRFR
jgi:hypothetical protein